MATTGSRPATDAPRKATLFCTTCRHESGVDDDWLVVETARRHRLLCPSCGTTIATRPTERERTGLDSPNDALYDVWQLWKEGFRVSQSLRRPVDEAP